MSAMALVIDDFAKYRISSIQIYSTFFWYHYSKCVFIRQLTNVCNVFASLLYNRIDERARKATPFHAVQFRATHTNMEKENGRTRHIRCSRTSNERTWALPIEPPAKRLPFIRLTSMCGRIILPRKHLICSFQPNSFILLPLIIKMADIRSIVCVIGIAAAAETCTPWTAHTNTLAHSQPHGQSRRRRIYEFRVGQMGLNAERWSSMA